MTSISDVRLASPLNFFIRNNDGSKQSYVLYNMEDNTNTWQTGETMDIISMLLEGLDNMFSTVYFTMMCEIEKFK